MSVPDLEGSGWETGVESERWISAQSEGEELHPEFWENIKYKAAKAKRMIKKKASRRIRDKTKQLLDMATPEMARRRLYPHALLPPIEAFCH
jgi:hypothetical protein